MECTLKTMQQLCNISDIFCMNINERRTLNFCKQQQPAYANLPNSLRKSHTLVIDLFVRFMMKLNIRHFLIENKTCNHNKRTFAASMLATKCDTFHLIKYFKYHERCSKLFPIDDLWIIAHEFFGYPEAIFIPVRIECAIFSLSLSPTVLHYNIRICFLCSNEHSFYVAQFTVALLKLQLNLYIVVRNCNASA